MIWQCYHKEYMQRKPEFEKTHEPKLALQHRL